MKTKYKATWWTKKELYELEQSFKERRAPNLPNRNPKSFRRKAIKKGFIKPMRYPKLTKQEQEKIRQLHKEKWTVQQIADSGYFGWRSKNSIQKLLLKINLRKKRKSKQRKKWKQGEIENFMAFLQVNSLNMARLEIAKIFDVSEATVKAWQKKLGVCPLKEEALALPFNQNRIKKARQSRIKKLFLAFEEHILREEKNRNRLIRIKIAKNELKNPEDRFDVKTCCVCGEVLPKTHSFFFHTQRKTRKQGQTYTSWYFNSSCKICKKKRAHQRTVKKYKQKYGG